MLLLIVPWTVFWERNYFIEGTRLGEVLTLHAVRGAISGLGVLCMAAGLAELWAWRLARRLLAERGPDPVLSIRERPEQGAD